MIKTVIFDMDGVIIDSEPVHRYAFFEHFKELGISMSNEEYSTLTGLSTKNVYEKLKEEYSLSEDVTSLVNAKRNIFNKAFEENEEITLLPGVQNLIEKLEDSGFQIILASSSARVTINRIFTRFKLYPFFKHIVSGEDFPQSKPNPAIFIEAVRLSGDDKSECIIIEDSTNGIIASNKAGVYCVAYDSEHSEGQDLSLANMVINKFSELTPEIIKNLS